MPRSPLDVKTIPPKASHGKSTIGVVAPDLGRQHESAAAHASPYEEAQCDEIEALRAIFMEDYEDVETKNAWSRTSQRCFKLHLRASSDRTVSLVLGATLTATYPKSVPLLHLEYVHNVRQKSLENMHSILRNLPLELAGEVMINEVAVAIQDALEDAAALQAHESLMPSLEQERAESEAAAARLAQEKEAEQRRLQEQEQAEEDRTMQRMLDEELKRRKEARKRRQVASSDSSVVESALSLSTATVTFDQPIQILSQDAADLAFRSVSVLGLIFMGKITEVYSVTPVLQTPSPTCLVLKRVKLSKCKRKEAILSLEDELERLKGLRHPNVVNILDFKMCNQDFDWNIEILTEHASNGSLRDLLQMIDCLNPSKARNFAIDMLQALDFYHKNGLVHGRFHCGNILLTTLANGATVLKVADAAFQDTLSILRHDAKERQRSSKKEFQAWKAPEVLLPGPNTKTRKTDIWDFGIVFIEMLFGQNPFIKFSSPQSFLNGAGLSDALEDMIRDVLRSDAKRRPNAFDIIPCEFLRTDAPTINRPSSPVYSRTASSAEFSLPGRYASRHESQQASSSSRYHTEWNEAGRLGRGGYGEVVKARNKLDGRIYAVKKITNKTPAELSQVLSEVYLLATLNHPYVVRYFTAWPEDEVALLDESSADITTSSDTNDFSTSEAHTSFAFEQSTGGLDFISSSGYPRIEFGDEDDEDDNDDVDVNDINEEASKDTPESTGHGGSHPKDGSSSSRGAQLEIQRTRSTSRAIVKSTLYIQMEYCERLTLRDMIRRGTFENSDDLWRLLRQILEGLVHIHNHHIIHRDLKPENVFIDVSNNPKIGDFGLATSGQHYLADNNDHIRNTGGDMTRSVGTTFYVAPELRSNVSGHYTEKVDMYSLGIMLFEMCYPLKTGMERYHTLTALREREHSLPEEFSSANKQIQGDIILSLIKHRPSERPSSAELLRSGKLPLQVEDETLRLALHGLNDPSSPYYYKMLSALFAQNEARLVRDQMWEMSGDHTTGHGAIEYMLLQGMVKDRMVACFRRHGAVESKRQTLFPRSSYYTGSNVVQLLDASGTLVQLPFDLTLPHARAIAKDGSVPGRSFAFGTVFREAATGSAPRSGREADFDMVSHDVIDNALREAEVIKVMDEIIDELPSFARTAICYHVNHSGLLEIILDTCRVGMPQRAAAKEILSKLNIQSGTWSKIRTELRAPTVGISSTSLDELAHFDFRDSVKKTHLKLQAMLAGGPHEAAFEKCSKQVQELEDKLRLIGVKRPVYWSPLSSFNDKFYKEAIMFQCLFDGKKRDVLAAGGRYDSLVEEHRPKFTSTTAVRRELYAVGISIAWDRLITSMLRYQKQGGSAFLKKGEDADKSQWTPRRCDCLVASFDSKTLRSTGLQILRELWLHDISAELAIDTRLPEELLAHYRDEKHSWIVIIKHDVNAAKPDIKVKNMDKREDVDIRSSELMSYLRGEIRDRDQREGSNERAKLLRHPNMSDPAVHKKMGPVTVLQTNFKRKVRINKWREVEAAHGKVRELTASMSNDAPILSIEIKDEILDMIRETRLSEPESWRRIVQNVPLADREYIQQVQDTLLKLKYQYAESTRNSFVYNFKTGSCIHYDLRF